MKITKIFKLELEYFYFVSIILDYIENFLEKLVFFIIFHLIL